MALQIKEHLLTPNSYSRPGIPLKKVRAIAVHYVGNPSSTAIANRNYFETLKDSKVYASSHYIIGLQGEIIRCIPENEVAYATYDANSYSISIENCHPKNDGKFNDLTRTSLVALCADICMRYKLNPMTDIIRHYDVPKSNGYRKPCPLYWVNNEADFVVFKKEVSLKIEDVDLKNAVNKMILKGIGIDAAMWSNTANMDLKYIPALLGKLGGVVELVNKKIISSPEIWISGKYTASNVRDLLIKYAKTL
ncbi:MAG: peptidoglycan recognition family protein [Cellulosilyticaceae bacterium]